MNFLLLRARPCMPLTVAFPDRKRRQFTQPLSSTVFELVKTIHTEFPMDAFRLYFQGREISHESETLGALGIPENALLRVDDAENPRTHPVNSEISQAVETGEDGESEISRIMGFKEFSSSKGKSHRASDLSGFRKTSRAHFRTFRVQKSRGIRASTEKT